LDGEQALHSWPLLAHDAVEGRIPWIAVGLDLILAHDTLEDRTDLFERAPRPGVVSLGPKLDPIYTEGLEAVLKQKLLALGVDAAAPKFTRYPGDADFDLSILTMNVEEPGRADDSVTIAMAHQEWVGVALLSVVQGGLEVWIEDGGI